MFAVQINPVPLMTLVELIRGQATSADSMAILIARTAPSEDGDGGFRANLEADPAVREKLADLASLFDPDHYLENIDVVFDRLNLGVPK